MSARDENTPVAATYGHGSITLTAYPSSRRIRVEATADNSVMDWSELFEFVDQIRQPRTITTLAEVQALPEDTIVRSHGGVPLEKWDGEVGAEWHVSGHRPWTDGELAKNLPATVLYEGGTK